MSKLIDRTDGIFEISVGFLRKFFISVVSVALIAVLGVLWVPSISVVVPFGIVAAFAERSIIMIAKTARELWNWREDD